MALHAVLFVDMTDSVGRAERVGSEQAAADFVRLHERLAECARASKGRVVKTLGDGALLAFPGGIEALATARLAVHSTEIDLPLRAAFAVGKVVEHDGDVFGDVVHVAARLLELATEGQILTTLDAVDRIASTGFRTRRLGGRQLRGRSEPVRIVEILPDDVEMLTEQATSLMTGPSKDRLLRLSFADTTLQCGGGASFEPVTVGRASDCLLVIDSGKVSRRHLTIHLRNGCFYVEDHSSNGTLIEVEDGAPIPLRNEETLLIGAGRIVPGTTRPSADHPHLRFAVLSFPATASNRPDLSGEAR